MKFENETENIVNALHDAITSPWPYFDPNKDFTDVPRHKPTAKYAEPFVDENAEKLDKPPYFAKDFNNLRLDYIYLVNWIARIEASLIAMRSLPENQINFINGDDWTSGQIGQMETLRTTLIKRIEDYQNVLGDVPALTPAPPLDVLTPQNTADADNFVNRIEKELSDLNLKITGLSEYIENGYNPRHLIDAWFKPTAKYKDLLNLQLKQMNSYKETLILELQYLDDFVEGKL